MTITREQVADLRPGDVVEITRRDKVQIHPNGDVYVGGQVLWWGADDKPASWCEHHDVTVISRAPCPLYVNHDRMQPVPGDVVRDANSPDSRLTWAAWQDGHAVTWQSTRSGISAPRENLPARLRLLVDGETGQVVP